MLVAILRRITSSLGDFVAALRRVMSSLGDFLTTAISKFRLAERGWDLSVWVQGQAHVTEAPLGEHQPGGHFAA